MSPQNTRYLKQQKEEKLFTSPWATASLRIDWTLVEERLVSEEKNS